MPIQDRVAAARRVDEILRRVIPLASFRLKYRISANPPAVTELGEGPEIVVDFTGPDAPLLLERNGELLRALEHIALKVLRLESEEHDKVSFDSMNFKVMRAQELHLAMRDHSDLRTESSGEAERRFVVVYPREYKGAVPAPIRSGRRR
jgi:spoIIIJ-associated protein